MDNNKETDQHEMMERTIWTTTDGRSRHRENKGGKEGGSIDNRWIHGGRRGDGCIDGRMDGWINN